MNWELVKDQIVRASVKDNDTRMYYAGGTFCIDFPGGVYCLNLDGQGFSSFGGKEEQLVQPEDVKKLVRETYLRVKGDTDFYKSQVAE
jgi:hypothetical protein